MSTDVKELIGDLDGGSFEERLSKVISQVAGAVVDHGKAGQVQITLKMNRIGTSYQVQIDHDLAYKRPTAKGKVAENAESSTPMYVGKGGALTFFPEDQGQLFDKKGKVEDK